MKRKVLAAVAATVGMVAAGPSSAVTLSGTIRDFCAPSISGVCTQLTDFEGAITGVVTGMVGSTLSGGLPTAGASIGAGASNATNFAKWFVDTAGTNLSAPFSLSLTEGPPGEFSYASSSFFPINGQLYGNQGRSNNYHFTVHLEGGIAFSDPTAGVDQFFTFTGDDDLWVFVDGKLVLDLGGVHGAATASFNEETLKSLGLLPGTLYDLDIFFAERHTTESNFRVTTTLDITGVPEPGTLALLGLGLAGLAGVAWRRRA